MQTNKKNLFLHPTGRQPPKHLKNITSAVYGLAQGICSFVGSNILADRNVMMVCLCVYGIECIQLTIVFFSLLNIKTFPLPPEK